MKSYHKENHTKEVEDVYERYLKDIKDSNETEILDTAVEIYEKIDEINNKYGMLNNPNQIDELNAYYTVCRIIESGDISDKYFGHHFDILDFDELEAIKQKLAKKLITALEEKKLDMILVIEPHHDDALGSSSSFLFDTNGIVTLYTIAKSDDSRDDVNLSEIWKKNMLSTNRSANIRKHHKCEFPDYHYDFRYENVEGGDITYEDLVKYYDKNYNFKNNLKNRIKDIFVNHRNCSYFVIPLGLMHPMHILTAYYSALEAINIGCADKIIFYIDHPYDLLVSKERIAQAQNFYQQLLLAEDLYVRMDSCMIDQKEVGIILREIYGEKHFAEFNGVLEKICCSYLVPSRSERTMEEKYSLHKNNVLYATYQAKPFLKTGGSGEVAFTYIDRLQRYVNGAAIIMPKHKRSMMNLPYPVVTKMNGDYHLVTYSEDGTYEIGEKTEKSYDCIELMDCVYSGVDFKIRLGSENYDCRIEKYVWRGIVYYLVDVSGLFNSVNLFDNENIFTEITAFCSAVIKSLKGTLDFLPTVIHCNDYQTSLIPFLLKHRYKNLNKSLKTIFTIHSCAYRGIYSKNKFVSLLNFTYDKCTECMICRKDNSENCVFRRISPYSREDIDKLGIHDDKVSLLKVGIVYADIVNTVSSGYARQISCYPDFSGIKVYGIRNGIQLSHHEYEYGNEKYSDPNICKVSYPDMMSSDDILSVKKKNKALFQKETGLTVDTDVPLFCMVSRLSGIKGIEDIKNILDNLMNLDIQLVIIGDDDKNIGGFTPYSNYFSYKQNQEPYSHKFKYFPFSDEMEYKAYYASDILLMPSHDEACGTTQMLAMNYGVIPIVSMIQGFEDTVVDYAKTKIGDGDGELYVSKPSNDKGVGFYTFKDDCWTLLNVIHGVIEKFHSNQDKWRRVVNSTFSVDFSWDNGSILKYLKLYNKLEDVHITGFMKGKMTDH